MEISPEHIFWRCCWNNIPFPDGVWQWDTTYLDGNPLCTPLMAAIYSGNKERVHHLLALSSPETIMHICPEGMTAAMAATSMNQPDTLQRIFERVGTPGLHGCINMALQHKNAPMIQILFSMDAEWGEGELLALLHSNLLTAQGLISIPHAMIWKDHVLLHIPSALLAEMDISGCVPALQVKVLAACHQKGALRPIPPPLIPHVSHQMISWGTTPQLLRNMGLSQTPNNIFAVLMSAGTAPMDIFAVFGRLCLGQPSLAQLGSAVGPAQFLHVECDIPHKPAGWQAG